MLVLVLLPRAALVLEEAVELQEGQHRIARWRQARRRNNDPVLKLYGYRHDFFHDYAWSQRPQTGHRQRGASLPWRRENSTGVRKTTQEVQKMSLVLAIFPAKHPSHVVAPNALPLV